MPAMPAVPRCLRCLRDATDAASDLTLAVELLMFFLPRGDAERREADGPGDATLEGHGLSTAQTVAGWSDSPSRMQDADEVAGLRADFQD
jgi:hypothetical protein